MVHTLRKIFDSSLIEFTSREAENILNGTSERNLCARWAPLLEKIATEGGFASYYADVEYNRKQDGKVKTILDEEWKVVSITCDLILHSRGNVVESDNLIAIEMKRSEHPEEEKRKDRMRLRAMTKSSYDGVWSNDGKLHPEHVCGYSLGFYVELVSAARLFWVEEYQKGELVDCFQHHF
ncbi:hypothetical protein [Shinella sp.]|uniref:hypothetical protein n=1 Tax=Shinella sp. TaxID=1870904 RepID=UPI0039E314B6